MNIYSEHSMSFNVRDSIDLMVENVKKKIEQETNENSKANC